MPEKVINDLAALGQSLWVDDLSRTMLEDGSLRGMINSGVRGMTSNPTIFERSIRESAAYDGQIEELCAELKNPGELYDALTIRDIRSAADLFRPVYEKTGGLDGYVSLEINPGLSGRTSESVAEVLRLSAAVNRPNVMFKIPASKEGFAAIEETTALGININITLIFSLEQYLKAAYAYLYGLKRLAAGEKSLKEIRSVASVFVSRIDTAVDALPETPPGLKGKAAVANSNVIYKKYLEIYSSREFSALKEKGANVQRVLWGSTGTKNPAYSDIKYVSELAAPGTVNTLPIKTFKAFLDHGEAVEAITPDSIRAAEEDLKKLGSAGVDVEKVCSRLLEEGVAAFVKSYEALLASLAAKTKALCGK